VIEFTAESDVDFEAIREALRDKPFRPRCVIGSTLVLDLTANFATNKTYSQLEDDAKRLLDSIRDRISGVRKVTLRLGETES